MSSGFEKIVWNSTFETGMEEIDRQHRLLVDTINQASHLLRDEYLQEDLRTIVNNLIRYTQFHFETEEQLMLERHYSHQSPHDYEKHIEEHFEFSTKVLEIHQQIQEGKSIEGEEIINYLCQWLVGHILHTDQVMVQTLYKNSR
ncbi:MAG: hypothetical protein KU38_12785 [Sulfurovum sp. FS08-3]|nr:MAG: hypothetical protein KU38_12785 [Sulfurovum sp. FS08-3]